MCYKQVSPIKAKKNRLPNFIPNFIFITIDHNERAFSCQDEPSFDNADGGGLSTRFSDGLDKLIPTLSLKEPLHFGVSHNENILTQHNNLSPAK